jgi:guanylate kinase
VVSPSDFYVSLKVAWTKKSIGLKCRKCVSRGYMSENDTDTGTLYIVAAPSGGGKTSLVKALVEGMSDIAISVSHTTRQKRPGEVDGVDYFFIEQGEFDRMVAENAFIEFATVFEHSYGTSKVQIEDRLRRGVDVLLDIDWQGAEQIKRLFEDTVGIFVIPPSLDALKQRLQNRKQDNESVIGSRMQRARDELSHYPAFDYMIVNDDFYCAVSELKSIVVANRLRMARQVQKQRKLLSFLLS